MRRLLTSLRYWPRRLDGRWKGGSRLIPVPPGLPLDLMALLLPDQPPEALPPSSRPAAPRPWLHISKMILESKLFVCRLGRSRQNISLPNFPLVTFLSCRCSACCGLPFKVLPWCNQHWPETIGWRSAMHGQKQLVPLYVWPESAPWHPLAGAPARFLPRVGDLNLHRPATAIPQHSWNLSSAALDRACGQTSAARRTNPSSSPTEFQKNCRCASFHNSVNPDHLIYSGINRTLRFSFFVGVSFFG